jgi:hypothetical protein
VHHEWGAGVILYTVASLAGAGGIMLLKYALTVGVAGACCWCARRRGASWAVILTLMPPIILSGCYGFTTIRAQLFTMQLLAVMLCFLELDQAGRRWWIAAWLPLHVLWLNVHAGFIVGVGLMALHAGEMLVRRRPWVHFVPVGMALAALVLVNPYGQEYLPYLLHGLTMARPMIIEWRPLWEHDLATFCVFSMSVLLVVYAGAQLGVRRLSGIVLLAATAYAAARHTRHLSLYYVAWLCYVPGYLQQTSLGATLETLWQRRARLIVAGSLFVAALCLVRVLPRAPWQMYLPVTAADEETGRPMYPAGAVDYLARAGFRGNLMVPFVPGGFVMWKLHPDVKVSLDGRYEVAYQHGILEENEAFYQASADWRAMLARYPTDAILVPRRCPLAAVMPEADGWQRTYRDAAYDIYARIGLGLPSEEHTGPIMPARFP